MKITGWNGVIDTPIHGVIDDETGNLCLSAYNYGKHDLPTGDGVVSVTKMLVGQAGKYYYGVSDDNSDSYYICTCSLDSKGKNGTYTYGDKSKFPIFPCRMGRAGL